MLTAFTVLVVVTTPLLLAAVIAREIEHHRATEHRWRKHRLEQLQARKRNTWTHEP